MEDIGSVYPLKPLNQNPTIGIGITTYKRPDILAQCLAGFKKYMPPNSTLFVNDDSERGEGISAAKNRCIAALEHCDYIFLFDDDIWPEKKYWWVPFIRGAIEHNCHVFSSSWDLPNTIPGVRNKYGSLCDMKWVCGVCVFFTSHVVKICGGYNIAFGRWGGEHEEFAQRAWLNGLAPYRLCDIDDSISYFYSLDKLNKVESTVSSKLTRTPPYVINHYISFKLPTYRIYKTSDIIFIFYNTCTNRYILENWIKTVPEKYTMYMLVDKIPDTKIKGLNYIDISYEPHILFLQLFKQYINSVTIVNPSSLSRFIESKQCSVSVISIDNCKQPWLLRVPGVSIADKVYSSVYTYIPKDNTMKYLLEYTSMLRHPMYADAPHHAAVNIVTMPVKKPIHIDMRPVVMILGCKRYRQSMNLAIKRFASPLWHVVAVEGGGDTPSYSEESQILTLDVEDTYDRLPMKVYKAFMWIIDKWPNAVGIFKTDEDIWFKDIRELEMNIAMKHTNLFWGMRVEQVDGASLTELSMTKMQDKTPGKTYPASHYCWGHGYYVARGALELLKQCSEDYNTQYLEDVCTGACLNRFGITPTPSKMKYIEVDRDAILCGEVKLQEGHKLDAVAWQQ